ncbi:MAG: thioredoxin domain-containing protein [Dehalococcoidia bacterium]|jgi:protein-disulfide isomerase
MQSKGYLLTVLLVTIITLGIGVALWNSGTQELAIDTECTGWCRGAEEPLVIIDAFPDFLCPICVNKQKLAVQTVDEIYPDEVRLDYHHYPYNQFSYTLSEALECAGEQGKFWELHDEFYLEHIPADMSEILVAAESIGMDMELFSQSLDSGKFREKVLAEKEQAIADNAQAASVYINRILYTGPSSSLSEFLKAIDAALDEARAYGGGQ